MSATDLSLLSDDDAITTSLEHLDSSEERLTADVIVTSREKRNSEASNDDAAMTSCEQQDFTKEVLSDDAMTTLCERHSAYSDDAAVTSDERHESAYMDDFWNDVMMTSCGQCVAPGIPSPGMNTNGVEPDGRDSTPGVTKRERKMVYKVTLQPRLSGSDLDSFIPPEYLELFEKLQPRIIAQGYASETESLLTLNRSLRPKQSTRKTPASSGKTPSPLTPLRVIGGRRMPPESFVKERQLSPWAVRTYSAGQVATRDEPRGQSPATFRDNHHDKSWGYSGEVHHFGQDLSSPKPGLHHRRPSLEEVRSMDKPAPFSVRPQSLGGTLRERQLLSSRIQGLGHHRNRDDQNSANNYNNNNDNNNDNNNNNEDDPWASLSTPRMISPSSYRAYSQRVFQNARKLDCFDPTEDAGSKVIDSSDELTGSDRKTPGRSLSVDCSRSVDRERNGPWSIPTSATSCFDSPPFASHVTSPRNENGITFPYNPGELELPSPSAPYRVVAPNVPAKDLRSRVTPDTQTDAEQESKGISGIESLFRVLAFSASQSPVDPEPQRQSGAATDRPFHQQSFNSEDVHVPETVASPPFEYDDPDSTRIQSSQRSWKSPVSPEQSDDHEGEVTPDGPRMSLHEESVKEESPSQRSELPSPMFVSKVTILFQRSPDHRKESEAQSPGNPVKCRIKQLSVQQLRSIPEQNDLSGE